ncbi:PD-(D/E)XK nuclease family transposase [bacterium]|nr:PD-(D/E)XK nuclease family transposase [bacterium]
MIPEKKNIFINPYTDFGFKRLFGTEKNKDILIDFLNELLRNEEDSIKNITFMNNEQIGAFDNDRRAVFDIVCENEKGEKFIVEMQKAKQLYFKDRALFYASFPIREQAKRGDWNFKLKAVYTIAILDFVFDEGKNDPDKFLYLVKLTDVDTKKVFYDKLTFVYLEMPKFKKSLAECKTRFEKWIYILKNLASMTEIPKGIGKAGVFKHLFKEAEFSKLTQKEQSKYEADLKVYRDYTNTVDTARIEGKAEGIEQERRMQGERRTQEKIETAKEMLSDEVPIKTIAKYTKLSIKEIQKLLKK